MSISNHDRTHEKEIDAAQHRASALAGQLAAGDRTIPEGKMNGEVIRIWGGLKNKLQGL